MIRRAHTWKCAYPVSDGAETQTVRDTATASNQIRSYVNTLDGTNTQLTAT